MTRSRRPALAASVLALTLASVSACSSSTAPGTGQQTPSSHTVSSVATSSPVVTSASPTPLESAPATPAPSPTQPPTDGTVVRYTVKGRQMAMACFGTGSPTVLVIPGLTASTSNWEAVARLASGRTRVCTWDRPGLGQSEQRPATAKPSVGDMGRELSALLLVAHVDPPYVVVAHSFGGLIARAFIAQRPADVRGVLMVDASTVGELRSPYFAGIQWWEGGSKTDVPRSIRELDVAGSLGATPLVVLTADSSGDLKKAWSPLQKTLAGLSTDSIHALAVGSGHVIQDDKPAIVLGAIAEVVEAASAGTTLPPCATTFPQRGGRCF